MFFQPGLPAKPSPALTSSTPAATPPHEYSAPLYVSAAQTQNPGRQSCTWRGLTGPQTGGARGGMVFHLQQEGTEPLVFSRTKLTNHVALQWQELIRE